MAIDSTGEPWRTGPFGERARALLTRHASGVIALMTAYGELTASAKSRSGRFVVTHGEPDARNVLKTPAGFVIVDWDFVRLAPPERDLWGLAETDRSALTAYAKATGTAVDSDALALFRMWYELSERSPATSTCSARPTTTPRTQRSPGETCSTSYAQPTAGPN